MRSVVVALATAGSVALATPAAAQTAGDWHVAGQVATFAFTLDCRFRTDGSNLSGECRDASTSDSKIKVGRIHPLTAGAVKGDRVSWTYQSSFLFSKFDVTFDGVQSGDRMSGTITVQGRKGAFTATRP
jgi:hypothetical protein